MNMHHSSLICFFHVLPPKSEDIRPDKKMMYTVSIGRMKRHSISRGKLRLLDKTAKSRIIFMLDIMILKGCYSS